MNITRFFLSSNTFISNHPEVFLEKVTKQLYWNRTSAGSSPVNLLHIFRTPFLKNTSGGLLLTFISNASLKWSKNQARTKQHTDAELLQFGNYVIRVIKKKKWSYFLKCAKNNYVCFNKMIWLLLIKMRLQIQNRFRRYGINKPWPNFLFTISETKRDY